MSYENPKQIYLKDHDVFIAIKTQEIIHLLEHKLREVGLAITGIQYYENNYCPERDRGCTCPHWFMIKIESIYDRIYEPNIWFMVCKRKRVYEVRWGHLDKEETFVEKDFWIKTPNFSRTQKVGKYIHSYGLKEVARDIKIAYQAAEIKNYKSKEYEEYYAKIFRQDTSND